MCVCVCVCVCASAPTRTGVPVYVCMIIEGTYHRAFAQREKNKKSPYHYILTQTLTAE